MKKLILLSLMLAAVITASAISLQGAWTGTLTPAPNVDLKLVFYIGEGDGKPTFKLDSPSQGAFGIPGTVEYLGADSLSVAIPAIGLSYSGRLAGGRIEGTMRQSGVSFALSLEPQSPDALSRPQNPKPPFPYTTQEVSVENPAGGSVLAGTLTLPDGADLSTPVLVMVTGSGPQNRDEELFNHKPFAVIADYLGRCGVATLRYDDRGTGASTGDASNATTADLTGDAGAVVGWLRGRGYKKVGVLGHSEGGTIAFMLGAKGDADFIVTLGAPAVGADTILAEQSARQLLNAGMPQQVADDYTAAVLKVYDLKKRGERVDVGAITAGWPPIPIYTQMRNNLQIIATNSNPWIDYSIAYDPSKDILAVKCPVFAAYGSLDRQVTPVNYEAMRRYRPNDDVRLFEGLNHLFQHAVSGDLSEYGEISETISPEVLEAIAAFATR